MKKNWLFIIFWILWSCGPKSIQPVAVNGQEKLFLADTSALQQLTDEQKTLLHAGDSLIFRDQGRPIFRRNGLLNSHRSYLKYRDGVYFVSRNPAADISGTVMVWLALISIFVLIGMYAARFSKKRAERVLIVLLVWAIIGLLAIVFHSWTIVSLGIVVLISYASARKSLRLIEIK